MVVCYKVRPPRLLTAYLHVAANAKTEGMKERLLVAVKEPQLLLGVDGEHIVHLLVVELEEGDTDVVLAARLVQGTENLANRARDDTSLRQE